jgi:hypothetical protein
MTRTPLLVWVTLPPGMSPEQLCREVQSCISFGKPEVQLKPDCTCGEAGHEQCDDPRHHISCGCKPAGEKPGGEVKDHHCGQCAPGYGHNNPTYGPSDLHDGPWVNW